MRSIFARFGVLMINFYQTCISPLFPSCCRFTPSCSEYAKIAISRFGLFYGSYISMKRILRCRPGCEYGYDPVPEVKGN